MIPNVYEMAQEIRDQRKRCKRLLENAKSQADWCDLDDAAAEAKNIARTASHNAEYLRVWSSAPQAVITQAVHDAELAQYDADDLCDLAEKLDS